MKPWTIEYWADARGKQSVEDWLNHLTKDELKSALKELRMLELCGNNLKLPHSKSLGKGLFELRERRYGYRIYYGFHGSKIIVLLHAGNKASQKNDIKVARERLAQLIEETL